MGRQDLHRAPQVEPPSSAAQNDAEAWFSEGLRILLGLLAESETDSVHEVARSANRPRPSTNDGSGYVRAALRRARAH